MLHVDIPTAPEIRALVETRADACVSLYVPTTPETQNTDASRIALANQGKAALAQLEANGFDKRRLAEIADALDDLRADDDFWAMQAHTLAVLVTPDRLRTFRLATAVPATVEVSDRFHLKPLLRAQAFTQHAFVLSLSENDVRLVEVFADLPPVVVNVPNMPRDAAHAVGRASVSNLTQGTRISNDEGQNKLLRTFARKVDAALRPLLAGRETPLVLAAADPLAAMFRNACSYPALLPDTVTGSPDRTSEADLAIAARPVLDAHYAAIVADVHELFGARAGDGRATTDVAQAARAATWGAVDTLLVDMAAVQPGTIDGDGALSFAESASAKSYDVLDEIAGRVLLSGGRVLPVRAEDLPEGASLAAVLRYAV